MEKVVIIIPAYNEEGNIEKLVNNLSQNYPMYDYIIVNDGSEDATSTICKNNNYNYVNLPINLGIGGAVQTGYQYALGQEYDIAIQIDGDGQHNLEYAQALIEAITKQECDIAIGSRFLKKEGFQSSRSRRLGINFLSFLIHMMCGKKIKDVTSGFRAVNKKFIKIYANNYSNDYPEPEAIVSAVMHSGKIKEIPVIMNEREVGTSSINFSKSIYYMIKVTLAIIVARISYGLRRE